MVAIATSPDHIERASPTAPMISHDSGRTVVWLDGEHDITTVFSLRLSLARATSSDDADIVVDLSGVTFLSAATIGALVRARNVLRAQARGLAVRRPSRCATRIIDVCGLHELIDTRTAP